MRVGTAGVTVSLPRGWHSWVPSSAVAPAFPNPLTRVVAVSGPFGFAPNGCQVAAYSFAPTAAAIVVLEWVRMGGRLPPRPASFGPRTLVLHRPPAIECFDGPGGSVQFTDRRRAFGVYLLAGRKASPRTVAQARAVLDSLRVR